MHNNVLNEKSSYGQESIDDSAQDPLVVYTQLNTGPPVCLSWDPKHFPKIRIYNLTRPSITKQKINIGICTAASCRALTAMLIRTLRAWIL